jgi:hypothetical protein
MSPKLTENIQKGLKEQSKMVHLDAYHQGEVIITHHREIVSD